MEDDNESCGGPQEACCVPGCSECGTPLKSLYDYEKPVKAKQGTTEMSIVTFKGCRHLSFTTKHCCKLKKLPHGGAGVYWERDKSVLPDESCVVNVQFCSLRCRLNGKVTCLEGMAECSKYERKEHSIEVEDGC